MPGASDPEYTRAREVLLDALDALGGQLDVVVLVGPQAVYLHTGEGDLALAPTTTDADIALAPDDLSSGLSTADAMAAGGFVLTEHVGYCATSYALVVSEADDLAHALSALVQFLGDSPLTGRIASLEYAFEGSGQDEIQQVLEDYHVTQELLVSSFVARRQLGRLNDVIHAVGISLALSHLLGPEEILSRPSLAAGNDPTRPFDVETNLRVCEFKLAQWDGNDAMRKRQVFKDLVHLAADESGRSRELYVLGQRPIRFLRSSTSSAGWALDRAPNTRLLFTERFGSLDASVSEFVSGPGGCVEIINLEEWLPKLFPAAS